MINQSFAKNGFISATVILSMGMTEPLSGLYSLNKYLDMGLCTRGFRRPLRFLGLARPSHST